MILFSKERVLFVENFLLWQSTSLKINLDRCFFVSFGFLNDLGVFMVQLNLESEVEAWSIESIGYTGDCFLVFVGGNYIDRLDQVVEKVEIIGKKLQSLPRAIIIDSQKGKRRYIRKTWPPLVSYCFKNSKLFKLMITGLLSSFQKRDQVFIQSPVSRRIHQQCV